jgi:hypothetical protein
VRERHRCATLAATATPPVDAAPEIVERHKPDRERVTAARAVAERSTRALVKELVL